MTPLAALLHEITHEITEALPEDVTVTMDAGEVRPALDADQIVVWILPPSEVTRINPHIMEVTWEPVVIGPTVGDPLAGLEEVEPPATLIADLYEAETIRYDSIQIGNSDPFPAAQIIFTTTTR